MRAQLEALESIQTWRQRVSGLDKPTDFAEAFAAKQEAAELRAFAHAILDGCAGEVVDWPREAKLAIDGDGWVAITRLVEHKMDGVQAKVWNACRAACIAAHKSAAHAPAVEPRAAAQEGSEEWRAFWAKYAEDYEAQFGHPPPPSNKALVDEAGYLRWRLEEIVPLLEEARDALPAITEAARKVHGIRPDLATRMDAAGTRTREDYAGAIVERDGASERARMLLNAKERWRQRAKSAEANLAGLIVAASEMLEAVAAETEYLATHKFNNAGAVDGAKPFENRVIECTAQLHATLASVGGSP